MDLLIWAGKVGLYWLFFYGFFYFFLRKLTHFHWNRFFLITSLVLSLVLPLLKIPKSATESLTSYGINLDAVSVFPGSEQNHEPYWIQIAGILYLVVTCVMLYRLVRRLYSLSQLWKRTPSVTGEEGNVGVHLLPDDKISSFSFFNKIAISKSDYAAHFDKILSHEMIHVKQRHSFDVLLTEVLAVFFWFHPILAFYKKSLQQTHEYLADQQTKDRDNYAAFLVAYTLGQSHLSLANNFYHSSLLKQRIHMLYRDKSSKWKFSFYGLSAVTVLFLTLIIAACSDSPKNEKDEQQPSASAFNATDIDNATDDEKIFTAVENIPQFPGGAAEMYKYLAANIRYPEAASRANVSGRVFLQFVVRSDGSISDIDVLKGIGSGCDEEALRVVKAMPRWKPGSQGGKTVNVSYTLPINFQLE